MINQNLLHLLNKFPFLCKESGAVQPRGSADPGAAARLPAAGGAAAHRHARQEQEVLRHLHHQRPPRQFHFKGEEGERRPGRQRAGVGRGGQGRRQGQQTCHWQVRPSTFYLSVRTSSMVCWVIKILCWFDVTYQYVQSSAFTQPGPTFWPNSVLGIC